MYSDLLHACEDDVSFGCVDNAKPKGLPNGSAREAWKKLKEKYEPKTGASKIELKREFSGCILKNDEDPSKWVVNLERLKSKLSNSFSYDISDEDMMIHVINSLPDKYDGLVDSFERQLISKSDPLTLETMNAQLRAKWKRMKSTTEKPWIKREKYGGSLKKKFDNLGLYHKQFKGTCMGCGVLGHKQADCFKNEKIKINVQHGGTNESPRLVNIARRQDI